jgi:hypothetical protein
MAATTTERRRPFTRPGSAVPALVAWAAFVAVFAVLVLQLRAGRDPVLGAAKRPVLVRRVVVTRVVRDRAPAPAAPAPAPVTTQSS